MTLSLPAAWAVSVVNALPPSWLERKRRREFENIVAPGIDAGEILSGEVLLVHIDAGQMQSPADLGNFFTTANDLLNVPSEDFLCSSPQLAFETAGTSGRNKGSFTTTRNLRAPPVESPSPCIFVECDRKTGF